MYLIIMEITFRICVPPTALAWPDGLDWSSQPPIRSRRSGNSLTRVWQREDTPTTLCLEYLFLLLLCFKLNAMWVVLVVGHLPQLLAGRLVWR